MNRFYVDRSLIGPETIKIVSSDDIPHFVRVLRVKTGEEVFVSDGDGGSYIAVARRLAKTEIVLAIKERLPKKKREDRPVRITLACAVPKYAHFEDIVDKATQLGVDEIIPMFTERTLIRKDIFDKKRQRLERIMIAAAKQSGALFLPRLRQFELFEDLMKDVPRFGLCLLPNLSSRSFALKDAVARLKNGDLLVLIGPEGDFTDDEVRKALQAGCLGITLGESVLRVDTAAIAVMSFLRLHYGL